MAPGKYSRIDGRRSSNYCSTVVVVTFVAFSLFAIWMYMTSSIVPTKYQNTSVEGNNNEAREKVTEFDSGRGDSNQDAGEQTFGNQSDNSDDENKEEVVVKDGGDKQDETKNVVETDQEEKTQEESDDDKTETNSTEESNVDSESDNAKNTEDNVEKVSTDKDTDVNLEKNVDVGDKDEVETSEKETTPVDTVEFGNKGSDTGDATNDGKVEENLEIKDKDKSSNEVLPAAGLSEILNETSTQNGAWSTQAAESQNEKKSQEIGYSWKVCNTTAGPDYIPCLDNWKVIRNLHDRSHYQHRERHCPNEAPTCLVPLPAGYKRSVQWPKSREKIWFYNVPHTKLADVKGHQNWVKVSGDYLTFPGGGTQFVHGALHYIELIEEGLADIDIAWGKRSRVVLDVGCGVASFGGYLFEKDVLTMSLAPKDEHEAQVQFALERGIPAILAVMGTQRLPFPGGVFDIVHCARCRVPWHIEGGKLLLELNRALRPGGFFVWSATPVYRKNTEDSGIWKAMSKLTKAMCWDIVVIKKDPLNGVAAAIYRKPTSNECYQQRPQNEPPLCKDSDDKNAAWKVELQACMHKIPTDLSERGSKWPERWPVRVEKPPYWLKNKAGVYGKAAPEDFAADYEHWKNVVSQSYLNGIGINWSSVRNVMDMRAVYGGFAAALEDLKLWVMNVVPIDSPDTLPIIFERGLFGMYHDWCESFNTYPRTYDLLHADHLFSLLKKRCNVVAVMAEVDRILRPNGKLIVRDDVETVREMENMAKSLQWDIKLVYSQDKEGLLCVQKSEWRPKDAEAITDAIII